MHAPIQLTEEDRATLFDALRYDDGKEERLLTKLLNHYDESGLGAMPGIRHAKDDLYYIDDPEPAIAALDYLIDQVDEDCRGVYVVRRNFYAARATPKEHRTAYELTHLDFAILAHAFTVYNAAKAKQKEPVK